MERTFSTCSKSIKHTDGKFLKYNFKISITDVIVTDIFNRQLWCVWRIVYVVVSLPLCCFRPSYKHAVAGTSSVVGKNFQIFLSADTRKQQGRSSSLSCRFFFFWDLYLHYLLHYLIELIFLKNVKNIFDFKTQRELRSQEVLNLGPLFRVWDLY